MYFDPACGGSLSSLVSLHLSPSLAGAFDLFVSWLAGGVRLSGSLSSLVRLHLSPCLAGGLRSSHVSVSQSAGGAWLVGCLSFTFSVVFLPDVVLFSFRFMRLPV